jgi:hypothetical protein
MSQFAIHDLWIIAIFFNKYNWHIATVPVYSYRITSYVACFIIEHHFLYKSVGVIYEREQFLTHVRCLERLAEEDPNCPTFLRQSTTNLGYFSSLSILKQRMVYQ